MQSYDLIMLLIVVATTVWGLWKGFAWQIASLVSVFSSYGVSYSLRAPVAKMIDAPAPLNTFIAMLVVYVLMSVVTWVGFGLLSTTISGLKLNDFDRQLGGLMGAAKGAIVCILVTFFAVTLLPPAKQEAICKSRSGRYIAIALRNAGGLIPSELHAVIDPYLDSFQNKLAQHQGDLPPVDHEAHAQQQQQVDEWSQWAAHAWQQQQQALQQQALQYAQQQFQQAQGNYYNQGYNNYNSAQQYGYPPPAASYNDPYYGQQQQGGSYYPQPGYGNTQYANPYPNQQPYAADPRYADPRYQQPQSAQPQYQDPRYQQPQQPTYGRRLNDGVEGSPAYQQSNQWR